MKKLFTFFLTLLSICFVKGQSSKTYCTQVWMDNNLTVDTYRNGDKIPNVTDPTAWNALTTGAWCWCNNDSAATAKYGKLYNWYAIKDARGLAPQGWHIPTESEWNLVDTCYESTLSFGYNASFRQYGEYGCYRDINGVFPSDHLQTCFWWSATENDTGLPISYWTRPILSFKLRKTTVDKQNGFSVLCIKD